MGCLIFLPKTILLNEASLNCEKVFLCLSITFYKKMYIDFKELPDSARVWIYQADRSWTSSEETELHQALQQFTETWDTHQKPVKASYLLKFNRFLVLVADNTFNAPSGCSIDKSAGLMRELGKKYQIDFFNRTHIIFRKGDQLEVAKIPELKAKISAQEILPQTTTFDNLVQTKKDFLENWEKMAQDTWLKRYFQ